MNSGANAGIGPASADIAGHRFVDVVVCRVRQKRKQRRRGHNLPGLAETALRDVMFDPSFLDGVERIRRAQPFNSCDLAVFVHEFDRERTGPERLPVHMHRTGAAHSDAATELCACKAEFIA